MADCPVPDSAAAESRRYRLFVLVLTLILLLTFLRMVSGMIIGVILGILLWSTTAGIYRRILKRMPRRPGAAAGIGVALSLIGIVAPLTGLVLLMGADASNLSDEAQKWFEPVRPQLEQQLHKLSRGNSVIVFGIEFTARDIAQRIEGLGGKVGGFILSAAQSTVGGIANGILTLFVALYTLFFFYLDGSAFVEWLKRLLPLPHAQTERLMQDFVSTARVSMRSMLVIGAIQGTLGGLAFWFCGIPAPLFWTMVMAAASIIPSVGAQIILVPASVILMLVGKTWLGIGLLLWGLVVVGSADNLLRPYLVRRGVELHELLVFLSTLGGITMFGFWGVVIGPVIASLLKVLLNMYMEIHHDDQSPVEPPA